MDIVDLRVATAAVVVVVAVVDAAAAVTVISHLCVRVRLYASFQNSHTTIKKETRIECLLRYTAIIFAFG